MSKITNDGLTRSGHTHMATVDVKELRVDTFCYCETQQADSVL